MSGRTLRIAVITDTAPPTSGGGVGVAHYNLVRALRQSKHDAQLFVFYELGAAPLHEGLLQGAVHRFGPGRTYLKIQQHLSRLVFGVLSPGKHAWNTGDIFSSLPGMRQMATALRSFDPDLVILPDHGAPALWMPRLSRAQHILIAHHNPLRVAGVDFETYSRLDARIAVVLEQKSLTRISKVISPSHHMREWFVQTYDFSGPQKVIPNIIIAEDLLNIAPVDLRPRLNLADDAVLICIPSAQTSLKGAWMLPKFLSNLAEWVDKPFGVFLPGEIDEKLKPLLGNLPVSVRLYTPGRLVWPEYIAFLKHCSFGVFTSLRDNYSMALAEALCCGVPMLAFNAGGNADIIQDGINGKLLPEGDETKLLDSALKLASSPSQLNALRRSTLEDAATRFDSSRTVQAYLDFLRE